MGQHIDTALDRTRAKTLSARMVLTILVRHAGKDDLLAWPSQATVASRAGISPRSVRTALRELQSLGEIVEVRSGRGRGASVYRVAILERDFDVIEPEPKRKLASYLDGEPNRNQASHFDGPESGSRVPICETPKAEAQRHQIGSVLPIEEIEGNTPSLPAFSQAESAGLRAEKTQAESSPIPKYKSDTSNGTVAGLPGVRAREAKTDPEDEPPVDPDAPYGRSAGGRPLTATGGIIFWKAEK